MKKIFLEISHHGFGHATQSAAVINELSKIWPNRDLLIRSLVPRKYLEQVILGEFNLIAEPPDPGVPMASPFAPNVEKTVTAYKEIDLRWGQEKKTIARHFSAFKPDLLMTNISYISLETAAEMGIKSVAFCSLIWNEILAGFAELNAIPRHILHRIAESYRKAGLFIQLRPGLPMSSIRVDHTFGPIVAGAGANKKTEFEKEYPNYKEKKWVLISLGGIEQSMSDLIWKPPRNALIWTTPGVDFNLSHENVRSLKAWPFGFLDLIQSSDLVITKPGYGMFSEIAMALKSCLYISRPGWPEEPYLVDWLRQYVDCRQISSENLKSPFFLQEFLKEIRTSPAAIAPTNQICLLAKAIESYV